MLAACKQASDNLSIVDENAEIIRSPPHVFVFMLALTFLAFVCVANERQPVSRRIRVCGLKPVPGRRGKLHVSLDKGGQGLENPTSGPTLCPCQTKRTHGRAWTRQDCIVEPTLTAGRPKIQPRERVSRYARPDVV